MNRVPPPNGVFGTVMAHDVSLRLIPDNGIVVLRSLLAFTESVMVTV